MLTIQELNHLSRLELLAELKKALKSLLELKLQVGTNQSKAIHELKNHKKYVARILTVIKELRNEKSQPNT